MAEKRTSSQWYRVAEVRPRLRSHVQVQRHHYRGQLWYVLQEPNTGRTHRLAPRAWQVAGLMDGERSLDEIWSSVSARLADDAPTQDEVIRLLGMLHSADMLRADVSPDLAEMLRRSQRREERELLQRLINPLSLKLPLFDPDAWLTTWLPLVKPLFSTAGALAIAAVICAGGLAALVHAEALAAGATRDLLDPAHLLLFALAYPIVKAAHELGHGFATKHWGGSVHEIGLMFLLFVPVPYVDASAANGFSDKRKRIAVSLAGIVVELFLASLALFVWIAAEPGWLRSAAYAVMLISGTSTLLFNGNPLLRFDGYYALSDWIEIPNLAERSKQYLIFLMLRRGFGMEAVRDPVCAPGEPRWFLFYGVASQLYRVMLMIAIALLVAGRFFVVGVLLAILTMFVQVALPLLKGLHFLATNPRVGGRRARALATVGGSVALAAVVLLVVPMPLMTVAEGVVWLPRDAEVRAPGDGFVVELLAEPGARVSAGDALLRIQDHELHAQLTILEARLRELRAQRMAERARSRVRAQIADDEIRTVAATLAQARRRVEEATVRSRADGRFVVADGAEILGRHLRQGEVIAHVVRPAIRVVRVVLPQDGAARVRARTDHVEVRLSRDLSQVHRATVDREVPAATDRLPSAALGTAGGGPFPVDPGDADGLRTLDEVFELDVALPAEASAREIGGRAFVRFEHGAEPLGFRLARGVRRVFLGRLGV